MLVDSWDLHCQVIGHFPKLMCQFYISSNLRDASSLTSHKKAEVLYKVAAFGMRFIEGVSSEITIYSSVRFSSFPDFARPGARLTDHPSNYVLLGYSLVLIQQQNSSLYDVKRLPKKMCRILLATKWSKFRRRYFHNLIGWKEENMTRWK